MRARIKVDCAAGAVMLATWLYLLSITDPNSRLDLVPRVVLYGLILVTTVWLISAFLEMRKWAAPAEKRSGVTLATKGAAAVLVVSIGYALLLPRAGFLISTPIFLAILAFCLGARSLWEIALTGVGVTMALYLIFTRLLQVVLP